MNVYTTILTDDEDYELSAIMVDGKYVMPTLQVNSLFTGIDSWDNEEYLVKQVYPYLKTGEPCDDLDDVFSEVREDVLALFDKAIELGFFKDLKAKEACSL
jgi:hypothetical protein